MGITTSGKIKAAVIGTGAMGKNHARVYAEMEEVKLVGVADADPATVQQVARLRHTRGFEDYCSLLDNEKPDLVSLAVPTRWHYPIARDLIERGIHVLVEKPFTQTLEEGNLLIEQAHSAGVKLGVGHIERFNPAVVELKEHLDDDELGRIFQIGVRRISGFPPRIRDVGVVLDLATHDLDVMRHLIGSEVARISAETAQRLDHPQEDILCGILRFQNGVIGLLNVNWLSPTKIRELTVHGERGMFVVNYLTQDLTFYENSYREGNWESLQVFRGVAEGRMIRFPVSRREPLRVELQSFVDSVLYDAPYPVSGEDGLEAIRLAQHLVKAGIEGTSECM